VLGISYDVLPKVTRELDADGRWRLTGGLSIAETQPRSSGSQLTALSSAWRGRRRFSAAFSSRGRAPAAARSMAVRSRAPLYLNYTNYTCGPLAKQSEPGDAAVYARLRGFLNADAAPLWPNATGPGGFKYDLLYADAGLRGEDRLKAQSTVLACQYRSDRALRHRRGRHRLRPPSTVEPQRQINRCAVLPLDSNRHEPPTWASRE
jgi:hypothetical protein